LSVQGCTGLTQDIDLSLCPNIIEVDASGTNINVIIPENSGITKYELGTPTTISIVNPTDLTPGAILVDDSTLLNSVTLVNLKNDL